MVSLTVFGLRIFRMIKQSFQDQLRDRVLDGYGLVFIIHIRFTCNTLRGGLGIHKTELK